MALPIQQFPILTAGQMSPFHQALQTGLENYMNVNKAAYEPSKLQADIAAKQAYSQYLPYQNIATAISNPLTLGMMSPAQRQLIFQALGQMASNIEKTPGSSNNTSTGIGALWDNLKNSLMGNNTPAPVTQGNSSEPTTPNEAINQYENNNPVARKALETTGQYVIPGAQNTPVTNNANPNLDLSNTTDYKVDPQIGQQSGFDMTSPSANALGIDTGSPEGNRAMALKMPSPAFTNAVAAAKAGQTAEAHTGAIVKTKEMNDLQKQATADSTSAYNLLLNANKFKQAYDRAWATGPGFALPIAKDVAQFDPAAREAANYASNAAVEMASKLFGNRQSDYREKLAQQLKFSTTMPKETVNNVYAGIQAETQRAQEHSDFVQEAQRLGIGDPNKIRNFWFDYNRDKPFYDIDSHSTITKNINSYPSYLKDRLENKKTGAPSPQQSVTPQKGDLVYNPKTRKLERV